MKTVSAGVLAILASRQFILVDLYTFTLVDGTVLRYCSGDVSIVYGGNTYLCGGFTGPYFKREGEGSTIKWETGLAVSTLEFTVYPGPSGAVNGTAFSTFCGQGGFDYADFRLDRAVMTTYNSLASGIIPNIFVGTTGEISSGAGGGERFTIYSYNDLLNIQIPRNTYQPPCINTLFDGACSLVKASFAVTGSCLTGTTASSINATLAQATEYFDLGSIRFTSGANNGAVRMVKSYTNGTPSNFLIIPPLSTVPTIADTFTAYPGCDKTQSTCQQKFDNLANFRGFPGIPYPETAV